MVMPIPPIMPVLLGQDITARLDKIVDSLDKEFLWNPERMCAILWLNFPNLCDPVPTVLAITLPPGASITIAYGVAPGFVELLVGKVFANVDVDFVMSFVQLYDNGRLLAQDPAMTNMEFEVKEWIPVLTQWTLILTNNSLLMNCTFHSWTISYAIEAKLFNYIKDKMRKLGLTVIPEEVLK